MMISLLLCQLRAPANSLSTMHCKSPKPLWRNWAGVFTPKFSQKLKGWAVSSSWHFMGRREGRIQRYSPLMFAQIQRISSVALRSDARDQSTVYSSGGIKFVQALGLELLLVLLQGSLHPCETFSWFNHLHSMPDTVNPTSQHFCLCHTPLERLHRRENL